MVFSVVLPHTYTVCPDQIQPPFSIHLHPSQSLIIIILLLGQFFKISHLKGNTWYLSFCVWLNSLNTVSSTSLNIAENSSILFYFMAELYSIVCIQTRNIFFIHSSVDGHLAQLLWIVP
jgi:hypothetical protein